MNKKILCFTLLLTFGLISSTISAPKICIDPGHGGSDPGAVSQGYNEKDLNLSTALKFRDWLNKDTQDTSGGYSWSVVMTRTTDVYVSLLARSSYANSNSVNRFFSIHHDAASASANGSSAFIYTTTGSTTTDYGTKVQEELISHGKLQDRGLRRENFHVLRETSMPSVLTENGFITSPVDIQKITSSSWQTEVTKGFMHALQRHYGQSAYTPSTSSAVTLITDNNNSLFSASSNWGTATWSSDKYGSDYCYRDTASTSDPATWGVNISQAGTYKIYAWWTAADNRASSAPYIIGSDVVHKNQQSNGGQWNLLGTYNLSAGYNEVQLSCWTTSGDVVIADAIKWQK